MGLKTAPAGSASATGSNSLRRGPVTDAELVKAAASSGWKALATTGAASDDEDLRRGSVTDRNLVKDPGSFGCCT